MILGMRQVGVSATMEALCLRNADVVVFCNYEAYDVEQSYNVGILISFSSNATIALRGNHLCGQMKSFICTRGSLDDFL
jgi:hypothetical protein